MNISIYHNKQHNTGVRLRCNSVRRTGRKGMHRSAVTGKIPSRKALQKMSEAMDLVCESKAERDQLARLIQQAEHDGRSVIQGVPVFIARLLLERGLDDVD